jgi:hypothetical protein
MGSLVEKGAVQTYSGHILSSYSLFLCFWDAHEWLGFNFRFPRNFLSILPMYICTWEFVLFTAYAAVYLASLTTPNHDLLTVVSAFVLASCCQSLLEGKRPKFENGMLREHVDAFKFRFVITSLLIPGRIVVAKWSALPLLKWSSMYMESRAILSPLSIGAYSQRCNDIGRCVEQKHIRFGLCDYYLTPQEYNKDVHLSNKWSGDDGCCTTFTIRPLRVSTRAPVAEGQISGFEFVEARSHPDCLQTAKQFYRCHYVPYTI